MTSVRMCVRVCVFHPRADQTCRRQRDALCAQPNEISPTEVRQLSGEVFAPPEHKEG